MNKKTVAIAGVGGGGLLLVYWYRNKQQSNAAATAAASNTNSSTSTTPSTDTSSGIDPATGYPYGSAEDEAALAANQGINYGYGAGSGYYDGSSTSTTPGPGTFVDNAQWAQYVEQYLTQNEGADPGTVGNAIGKYITGQPLTTDMVQVVQSAIAIGGNPPVPGSNGNPPGYSTGGTGGGGANPGVQEYAPGGKNFTQLAAQYGTTTSAIQKVNPKLYSMYGASKPLPKGAGWYLPSGWS